VKPLSNGFESRIAELFQAEQRQFDARHVRSTQLFARGQQHWLYGAPSHWMRRWIGGAPVCISHRVGGYGVRIADVDGNEYVDFCLGDTGGMCGHGHPAIAEALARQAAAGSSLMLPTQDAEWVGNELQRRFGLPYWNLTTSASDANRACIRLARMVTGRDRVLVFSGCYHGSVEEAHVELRDGAMVLRNNIHPNGFPHDRLCKVVEFNDVEALRRELERGDIACVLTEPAMTNYGMVAPDPGFHDSLREITRASGTLLIIDETHTWSSGPGGYMREHALDPDFFVVGKAIAGGVPAAAFGLSEATAVCVWKILPRVPPTQRQSAHAGFGGTLAGNALTLAAMRAVLEQVLTDAAFQRMTQLAEQLEVGANRAIREAGLSWHATRIGARAEILFSPDAPRNASEVRQSRHPDLEALLHLYLLNRGVLITPFHNMMLMSPGTQRADVEQFDRAFSSFVTQLTT
jgi:glutamate-1-semialdehyde 2,1-aminomutase